MKRSPLKRKTPLRPTRETKHYVREREERFPGVDIDAIHKKPRGSYGPAELQAAPKREYVRSEKLREAYRLIPCQWPGCGIDNGTVCCAHSNWSEHGKAGALKADDNAGASLCFTHHSALDQGSRMSYEERRAGWEAAHKATVRELVRRNLWPAGVPLPL